MTTTAQQTALEKPVAHVAFFIWLDFLDKPLAQGGVSTPIRFCTYSSTFTWGGYDWIGAGAIGSLSAINEAEGTTSSAMTFGLNVADLSLLSLSIGEVDNWRGRGAKLYFCPLTDTGLLIDKPMIAWRGFMDSITVSADANGSQILLKCETSAFGLKRKLNKRMNAQQQKARATQGANVYSTDTGFDQVIDLIAKQTTWLSKKFQQQP